MRREFSIVGTSFIPGSWALVERLRPNQPVSLLRQPTNKHDANAIGIFIGNQHVGYIPRGFAAELAPLMDAGQSVKCAKAANVMPGVCVATWPDPNPED